VLAASAAALLGVRRRRPAADGIGGEAS
jgi:hypothetical protein